MQSVTGIHHITAIAGDPQENLAFYQGVLGMRLVKRSINQDAPDTYHLFFADNAGNPGTDLTFFPWPHLGPGRQGAGNWGEVALTIPPGSSAYWQQRFDRFAVDYDARQQRFGETVLPFRDPHGMQLALIETDLYDGFHYAAWSAGPVPAEYQIRGLGGVRLMVRSQEATAGFFSTALGFVAGESENGWQRYSVGQGVSGQRFDLMVTSDAPRGEWGVGSVHHVAWRVPDQEQGRAFRERIVQSGGRPTDSIDRFWFTSIYTREPGGALCELATDGPGFSVDEELEKLGSSLVLPSWYEPQRTQIEAGLPALQDVDVETYR